MNVAGIMKHRWWIASHRKSIWVDWIYKRDKVEGVIMHMVGNGRATGVWLDSWHPKGILIKKFGERIRYDSGLSHLATVDEILRNGEWLPTPATTLDLIEAWGCLQTIPRLHYGDEDLVVWKGDPTGVFTTKSAWEIVRRKERKLDWKKSVCLKATYLDIHSQPGDV
ncbi:uncharacterized protein LOC122092205 [Macadamia integrifolia]|uniref:uncharacterized protein LOC122092205 n=1 Tax=Macadamia integrifolia TaxID=60698 RepID=UPI001C4ED541|nr:uncharacterized protein LOC122092205 [Macadamia integrifolia]